MEDVFDDVPDLTDDVPEKGKGKAKGKSKPADICSHCLKDVKDGSWVSRECLGISFQTLYCTECVKETGAEVVRPLHKERKPRVKKEPVKKKTAKSTKKPKKNGKKSKPRKKDS